ncbi:MAG: outer membrane protein [Hyphomicrobiaceae bacterium]
MRSSFIVRAVATVLLVAVSSFDTAQAQRYDGGGLLKFGMFGQGTFLDFGVDRPASASASSNGLGAGLSLGYDVLNRNGWLYGIEVDGSFGDARDTALGTSYGFDYMATLRGRAGVYARSDLLLYGTAGIAFLGFEAQRSGTTNKAYETMTGLTVGVGAEWDWHHTLLFAEYLYAGFGSREFTLNNVRHEADADAHLLRFGIKFKTGHDHEHGVSRDRNYGDYRSMK